MMNRKAFTLIELLVVVLILGLLSSLAVGVFTTQVERARRAAARSDIATFELAVERYHIDVGQYPPSGSQTQSGDAVGSGYLQLALMHSMSADSSNTTGTLWKGPYITVKKEKLGNLGGVLLEELTVPPTPDDVQLLDPWRQPYRFIRKSDYPTLGGTVLPSTHPYAVTEVYYNPNTFQIVSNGNNGTTLPSPNQGTDGDDVTNFGQ